MTALANAARSSSLPVPNLKWGYGVLAGEDVGGLQPEQGAMVCAAAELDDAFEESVQIGVGVAGKTGDAVEYVVAVPERTRSVEELGTGRWSRSAPSGIHRT
ncbi:hypothetical protein GTW51_22335 [Aurantimonas aggregata]|uniref:Uncharacterized protein n=1 Tax=Aurantimonas aggregata TaxID=2047720 RepID=A0A6L9MNJ9_9HYPH|nr:hypothetical protein [Aurantimonas aggregata]NDV89393.1 hypothetical protein [Aurantimonas aggregata]